MSITFIPLNKSQYTGPDKSITQQGKDAENGPNFSQEKAWDDPSTAEVSH